MDLQQVWQTVQNWLTTTGIKVVISIVIMIVSFSIINWLSKKIAKRADKKVESNKKIDKTIYRTLSYVAKVGLKVLVVIALIGYVGIDTSAITALIVSVLQSTARFPTSRAEYSSSSQGLLKTTITSTRADIRARWKISVYATPSSVPRTTR